MIVISAALKDKLVELDYNLHDLGKNLYGRKLFREYEEDNTYHNFHIELHRDGSFTLHFLKSILGSMEKKTLNSQESEVINELDLLISLVKHKLNMVRAY